MTNLMSILTTITRIEVAFSRLDKAIRDFGERRRSQNSRWMNG